jgi:PTH1 family peptidyl-tRNA hydrolase
VNYVLKKPAPEQREGIEKAIEQSLKASDLLLAGDMDKALALIHAQPARPKPPRKEPPARPKPVAPATDAAAPTAAAIPPLDPAPEGEDK